MRKDILSANRRLRRKRLFLRICFVFLLLVFLLGGAVAGLFALNKLKINHVVVEGLSVLQAEEVRYQINLIMSAKIYGIIPQDRIFSFPLEEAQGTLKARFGRLGDVELRKDFPSTILIVAEERKPVALLCVLGSKDCFFVDKTGYIFEKAPFFSAGVFTKFFDERRLRPSIGQFLLDEHNLKRLFGFKKQVEALSRLTEIHLKDDGIYELYLAEGYYLILDAADDWDLVYENFETFLRDYTRDKDADFKNIDLRFGNKIFYKLKDGGEE